MAAAEEQSREAQRRKAVEKPLRGKVHKTDFPTALGNPHTPRISTFRTASTTTGKLTMHHHDKRGHFYCLKQGDISIVR
jgi:hypothetical protein